ncbi:MAG: response regulator [Pseudomonadota bacterium]
MANLRNILFVEDDLTTRTQAKLALEVIGRYTVRECRSGSDALEAASTFLPDLIVLDAGLLTRDGADTLSMLRGVARLANTPVLFISSESEPGQVHDKRAIGVIVKPFMPLRLADQLATLWRRHSAL